MACNCIKKHKDLLLNFLSEDECKKVENYYKKSKFFQDYILVSKIEHESLSNLIKEFFLSYFARVEYLEKMDERRYLQLNKWIIKKGKNKIKELLDYTKEDINKEGVVNILVTYDGLIEQGMDEDADCLLDILIDVPLSIYKEMLYLESKIICTNKSKR